MSLKTQKQRIASLIVEVLHGAGTGDAAAPGHLGKDPRSVASHEKI